MGKMTPTQMFDLGGKRALITGGSSGLGLAIAQAFNAAGAVVMIAGNRADELARVAKEMDVLDAHVALDTRTACEELAVYAQDKMGGVDILVSNAGIEGPLSGAAGVEEAEYRRAFDVNLHAASWLCEALVPDMARTGGGSVILMASIAALRGNKAIGTYALTKAALAQLARNIAVAYGPQDVRANAIAPGLIKTPFSKALVSDEAFMERRIQATPLRRVGEADEIAATALWLAGAGGAFVTGQTIVVDGGTLVSDGN